MKPLPMVIPPGLRFSCHLCGVCCRKFTVDLDDGEAARIARHDWAAEDLRFRDGFIARGVDAWGEERDELRKIGEACIFLDSDGLCLVEKRLGREAKPRICRKFPYVFVAAPDGERVSVSIECASRWRSAGTGTPVEASRAELEVLRTQSTPHRTKWRVQVAAGGRFLAPEEYLELERRLGEELAAPRPLAAALGGMAAALEEARLTGSGDVEGGWVVPGAEDEVAAGGDPAAFDAALGRLFAAGGAVEVAAIERDGELVAAVCDLRAAPAAWREALGAAEAVPGGAELIRTLLAGWLTEAIPGRNSTAEDGVGQMIFAAIVTAALGLVLAAPGPPDPAKWNLAAREVSLFIRGKHGRRMRELAGGDAFAPLCRAAAGVA